MVKTITDANFSSVLNENEITVVDFWADWCGPCKMLIPIIDNLSEKNNDVSIGKVNIDDVSSLATKYGIRNIPTLLFFKNGQVVDKAIGVQSEVMLQNKINSLK